MLANYLKVALRMLSRERGYAVLNVSGLAIGLACCALIVLYVRDELSYDRHHENADRLVRVTRPTASGSHWAAVGPPLGPALDAAFPEIETSVRLFKLGSGQTFRIDGEVVEAPNGVYADATIFDAFTLPLIEGDADEALADPNSIALTASTARRFFGDGEPVGRTVQWPGFDDLTVTAVLSDPPSTTHAPFDYLVSLQTFIEREGDWLDEARTWAGLYTYLLLRTPDDLARLQPKLDGFVDDFFDPDYEEQASTQTQLELQPITEIHLHSRLEKEYASNSNILYVLVFGLVAAFILVIAAVNFVNLTTARSGARLLEIGVRKAMGSSRSQLARQFLVESTVMSAIALVLALALIAVGLPVLNDVTGKSLTVGSAWSPAAAVGLLALAMLTGLVSGIYPAWYLSGATPSKALREGKADSRPALLRSGLVVFQFALSIFMIVGTATVYQQLSYVRSAALGFEKENVIQVSLDNESARRVREGLDAFKQELMRGPSIAHASLASDAPGERYSLEFMRLRGDEESHMMRVAWGVDHDYASTLGLTLVAGRDFSTEAPVDTSAWLINEAAAATFGIEDPVGRVVQWGDQYAGPIVGIVEDFHIASLHGPIEPLVIPLRPGVGGTLLVRIQGDVPHAVAHVRDRLEALSPGAPFRFTFLDDAFDALYRQEERLSDIFTIFAGLAIVIACLGLFGLAAYTASRRRKEIGIRKVLGASVTHLVGLLSGEFVRLVAIAFVIAAPAAYLVMERWLEGFAFRVSMGLWVFVAAGVLALVVALMTVGFHSVRAATADPVRSLRYE